jgi:hypothetical protein
MKKKIFAFLLAVMPLATNATRAEFILTPLTSFSDTGWLSPTDTSQLFGQVPPGPPTPDANPAQAARQRGIAYSGATNELFFVDRNGGNFVRVLNGTTGASLPDLNTAGLAGGTFVLNMIDVADDGAIYAANLSGAAATAFSVYRWANSAAAPTTAFSATTGFTRTGDSFAVTGSGANTRIISAGGTGTNPAGAAVLDTVNGTDFTLSSAAVFTATPGTTLPSGPGSNNALRLGLDFIDQNTAIGKQTGTTFYTAALSAEGSPGPASTVLTAPTPSTLLNANENILAYTTTGSIPLLATLETNSSLVRLYNATDLNSLVLLSSSNLTTGTFQTNLNAVGDLTFGVGPDGLRLYALNSNNGIQAFSVSAVPEPSSIALVTLGAVGIVARRRQLAARKQVS